MTCKPKAHAEIECPYCGQQQIHSQAFEPEAHVCYRCSRTFVAIPRIDVFRVEGQISRIKETA